MKVVATTASPKQGEFGRAARLVLPPFGLLALALFWFWWGHDVWVRQGLFFLIGVDWGMFWAAAHAFRGAGPASIYDLNRLGAFVQPLIGYYGPATDFIKVNPVPYPPIFVLLVMPFSLFSPVVGFVLWTAANAIASAYVVTRLARRVGLPVWLVVPTALLWLPLGLGLFVGQPVGLLLLAFYKLYDEIEQGHEVRAGAWGGILLLKPQYAFVLLLVFLLKRRLRLLEGFALTGAVIGFTTLVILGPGGIIALIHSMSGYASGFRDTSIRMAPQEMVSWRGLLAAVLPVVRDRVGLLATFLLTIVTLAAVPFIWRDAWDPADDDFHLRMLGTMVVTMLVGFDVHIHGAVLLLVPLILVAFGRHDDRAVRRLFVTSLYATPFVAVPMDILWHHPLVVCMGVLTTIFELALLWHVLAVEYHRRQVTQHAPAPAVTVGTADLAPRLTPLRRGSIRPAPPPARTERSTAPDRAPIR